MTYTRHRDTQETLQTIDRMELDTEHDAVGEGGAEQELYRRCKCSSLALVLLICIFPKKRRISRECAIEILFHAK